MPRKTLYQRIAHAADCGRGIKLTGAEVALLAQDGVVSSLAKMDSILAALPKDEREHIECFTPKSKPQPPHVLNEGDCLGDGWYGCNYCWRLLRKEQ